MPNFIYVFLISMLPFIELRGAIPVGAALDLPFYVNFPIAVVANLLPVPFILLFIPRILEFLKRFNIYQQFLSSKNQILIMNAYQKIRNKRSKNELEKSSN